MLESRLRAYHSKGSSPTVMEGVDSMSTPSITAAPTAFVSLKNRDVRATITTVAGAFRRQTPLPPPTENSAVGASDHCAVHAALVASGVRHRSVGESRFGRRGGDPLRALDDQLPGLRLAADAAGTQHHQAAPGAPADETRREVQDPPRHVFHLALAAARDLPLLCDAQHHQPQRREMVSRTGGPNGGEGARDRGRLRQSRAAEGGARGDHSGAAPRAHARRGDSVNALRRIRESGTLYRAILRPGRAARRGAVAGPIRIAPRSIPRRMAEGAGGGRRGP